MKRCLLDVNVFFAMVWPIHTHHQAARAWYESAGHRAWATSPLTELGVLRLLTNQAATLGGMSAQGALTVLDRAKEHPGHEYWELGSGLTLGLRASAARMQGHSQWTDAALLWQAANRKGVLVTFDAGVRELAGPEHRDLVLVLKR